MAIATFSVFFFLFHLVLLNSADSKCHKTFECGDFGSLEFPFAPHKQPNCGLFKVDCNSSYPRIQLEDGGRWYGFINKTSTNKLRISDPILQSQLSYKNCSSFRNLSLPNSPSSSFIIKPNFTLFICGKDPNDRENTQDYFKNYTKYTGCGACAVYYRNPVFPSPTPESNIPRSCSKVQLPIKPNLNPRDFFDMLTAEFSLEWHVSDVCYHCHSKGGQCSANSKNEFMCKQEEKGLSTVKLATAISGGGIFLLLCLLISFILWQRKKRINSAYLLSRNKSSDPCSKSDIEGGSFYFGIPVFCYTELQEATNNFDSCKELGDGGFGTVYYGKLRDGREVAIKRLYEHNCKRVEQFMNEIQILTCLRHRNLVSLYGCTSRRSRELLLVYEYIPNGTVADHLHGERANEAPLTWPVRMNIAIETATALAYLHESDIIHRDIKTTNILLDNNFCVKVADFGLSRLFPNDVSHVSTTPQGTPGYVDPEYYQSYQLTDKSDVYSFGVVLIELISSMPAVDISRHRHEINLANLAMNRIQRCAFDELIDSSLGYNSDAEVTRMTTSVAELAFRCLQLEKDMRPSMDEVLDFLKDIRGGDEEFKSEMIEEVNDDKSVPGKILPSPETDDVLLLKNKYFQPSPNTVTNTWVSSSTTTSSVG